MVKKGGFCCVMLLLAVLFSVTPVAAQASDKDNTEEDAEAQGAAAFDAFRAEIPAEVAELLPDEFFSQDMTEVAGAMEELGSVSGVLRFLRELFGVSLREDLALLASLAGLLVLSAILRAFAADLDGGVGQAFSFCSIGALAVLIFRQSLTGIPRLALYFQNFHTLASSFVPLMGTLYALGGNVRAAAANHAVMAVFLSVAERICSGAVLPVAGACLALTLPDALTGRTTLKPLAALIKRSFTLGLSFLMLLLSFLLGLQTTLAAGADTLALRTVRFAAGSFLPIVGSSVSEALKTVSGSIAYLRTLAGTGGILVVLFLFLPMFVSLLVTRIVFLLTGALAELVGATGEGKLLSELASVYGFFLAVIAALFVMTVFALTIFTHCAVAGA